MPALLVFLRVLIYPLYPFLLRGLIYLGSMFAGAIAATFAQLFMNKRKEKEKERRRLAQARATRQNK